MADNSTRLTSPLPLPASRPLSGCDPTFLRLGGGPPRPEIQMPVCCVPLRAVQRGRKAAVTAPVRRVSSSEKLQPPASSLYNVAGACEAAGRFSWQRLRRRMHCNVPPQPARPLQFSGSGIHPWMGILSRLVLTTPPLSPAGAPGIGETRRTLLSPPSSPDPVRLATGILRGAHFETLVFPAPSSNNPVRPSLEADAGVWQTRL